MSYDDNNSHHDLELDDVEDYSADYPNDAAAGGSGGDVYNPSKDSNMAPAAEDNNAFGDESKNPRYRRGMVISLIRNNKWAAAVVCVVLIVFIGVLAATVGKENGGGSSKMSSASSSKGPSSKGTSSANNLGGVPPVYMTSDQVDPDVLTKLRTTIENVYDRHGLDKGLLQEDADQAPQRQALLFMAKDTNVNAMEHTEKLQRFVMSVFFFSTNMIPSVHVKEPGAWKVADKWMTNAHSCDWMGVICDDDKVITSMVLERNRLSGKIPVDISIIANGITSLDFTDNIMHMRESDFDAFLSLKNLHTLLMDDNYLFHDDGLPPQFGALTNLEKIRLSYNIFEGDLDDSDDSDVPILGAMRKLTHLEMESNYFSGPFPKAIAKMDKLTYCYLRRNDMTFDLEFIKDGQYTDTMFAMWLDGNDITGTIPTEIGTLTGLASFSLANSTVTGTIPTEFGNLPDLRRLWLFNNKLTGTIPSELNQLDRLEVVELHGNKLKGDMPSQVCEAVAKSDYEYKSLTSDCKKEVNCASPECCTECF